MMNPREEMDEEEDREALMRRGPAVAGLKVADDDELFTVQRVFGASVGLFALMLLHFIVHLLHSGRFIHGFFHLITSATLPALGYYAVKERSTSTVWCFHMGNVLFACAHAVTLVVVVLMLITLMNMDVHTECTAPAAPATTSPEYQAQQAADLAKQKAACVEKLTKAQGKAPGLVMWWFVMSIPMWGLTLFAAWHALEFYVQLRLRNLGARIEGSRATVFEREQAE